MSTNRITLAANVATVLLVGGGTAAASMPPDGAGALPVVGVTLDDFSFTMPDTLPAGAVRIEATNELFEYGFAISDGFDGQGRVPASRFAGEGWRAK